MQKVNLKSKPIDGSTLRTTFKPIMNDYPSQYSLNVRSASEDSKDIRFHEILDPIYIAIARRGENEEDLQKVNLKSKPIDGSTLRTTFKPIMNGRKVNVEEATKFSIINENIDFLH